MRDLRRRVAWAASRNLTMANLFENLARVYGEAEAMKVTSPTTCKYFPGGVVTHERALRFTNLAAEALIDRMDLLKGERVLVAAPDAGEGFLLAAAVIKAGGVAIPAAATAGDEELASLARGCNVRAALVNTRLLEDCPRLRGALGAKVRLVALDEGAQNGRDVPLLYEAMEKASGFFLPYTLKPSNVVLLCGVRGGDGSLRAVMVTNRGLMSTSRLLPVLLPARAGDICLVCSQPARPSLFAAVVLALVAGMRLRFASSPEPGRLPSMVEEERPAAVLGHPHELCGLAGAYAGEEERSLPAVWLSAGLLGEEERELLRRLQVAAVPGAAHWLVETFTAGENATVAGLRVSRSGRPCRVALPCVALPPNRVRCVRDGGIPVRRGEEGELALRGPAVTPGYWNDLETTFRNWRNGWLYTGQRGTRSSWGIPRGSGA